MTSPNTTISVVVHLGGGHDRPAIGARRVYRHTGYLGLVSKLYEMTKTDRRQFFLKISAALRDNGEVQFIPINNDGDLWFFFAPEAGNQHVSLYVETEQSQTSAPVGISSSNNLVNNNPAPAPAPVPVCIDEQRIAREDVNETWETSVRKLPKLLGALKKWNAGTIVEWQHMPGGIGQVQMLKYLFWAFKPCIDGFEHCRRVICVDRTHLYTKYKHKLLIAVSMDANNSILPLAYAIVDKETVDSWTWFIQMIAVHVARGRNHMCLICNMHPGLLEAVKRVPLFQPPHGVHRFCLRQVCCNLYNKVENKVLKDLCWAAGSAGSIRAFENVMNQIKSMNQEAYDYLQSMDKSRWTVAYDIAWRSGVLTTNLSECMRGVLKDTRKLSICAFVQFTLYRSVTYFLHRSSIGRALQQKAQPWPDTVHKKYEQIKREALLHHVYKVDLIAHTATLKTFVPGSTVGQTHVVKLPARECSCGQWGQNDVMCSHAMRTLHHFGLDPTTFILWFYKTSSFVATYSGRFNPIPRESWWDEPSFELCHNPAICERQCKRKRQTPGNQHVVDDSQSCVWQQYCAPGPAFDTPGTRNHW